LPAPELTWAKAGAEVRKRRATAVAAKVLKPENLVIRTSKGFEALKNSAAAVFCDKDRGCAAEFLCSCIQSIYRRRRREL
jgi:hypothetical protein